MISYVAFLLTGIIAVIGILVKTKEETTNSKFYKLSKGGWVLITCVVLLFGFNLFLQLQKDKIQKLQDHNVSVPFFRSVRN
jgi:uncharacterized membrane protein YjfL (UPF0719 family)